MRTMVADDKDLFRVVIVKRRQEQNPDYKQGNGQRFYRYTDETYEAHYGPYNQIGPAKSIRTKEMWDSYNSAPHEGVVDGWIEKGETKWTKVEL